MQSHRPKKSVSALFCFRAVGGWIVVAIVLSGIHAASGYAMGCHRDLFALETFYR
jgi:hypothetical protein